MSCTYSSLQLKYFLFYSLLSFFSFSSIALLFCATLFLFLFLFRLSFFFHHTSWFLFYNSMQSMHHCWSSFFLPISLSRSISISISSCFSTFISFSSLQHFAFSCHPLSSHYITYYLPFLLFFFHNHRIMSSNGRIFL